MEALHGVINDINNFLWTYVIIVALIGSGVIYTLRTKFVQVRLLGEMIRLIFGSAGQHGVARRRRQHCGRCNRNRHGRSRRSFLDVVDRLYRLRDGFC